MYEFQSTTNFRDQTKFLENLGNSIKLSETISQNNVISAKHQFHVAAKNS